MATIGVKLSEEIREKMWVLFSQGMSERTIGQKLAISRTTVTKYRKREKWDERREKIIKKAEAKADNQQVSLLAENMKIVRFAKGRIIEQLKQAALKDITKTPIPDLDKIIRLEEFLQGRPDSRPQIDYSKLSEEQLTIEVRAMIIDLMEIPECKAELQKLLNSGRE